MRRTAALGISGDHERHSFAAIDRLPAWSRALRILAILIAMLGASSDPKLARGEDLEVLRPAPSGLVLLAQADPSPASATETAAERDPWAGVEELIVTGSDQASVLLGAPTSVTSFDALELEAQAVQDVGDLSAITPNLEIRRPSATQASFFIRGVGLADFGANATSAVAVRQDGVGLNTAPLQLGQIYDARSVDVLRGPQGSGPYRNASAGAIVTTSRKPEFDVQASLRARLGTWAPSVRGAKQGLIQDYEGMLNIPLVEDVLATRFAFRIRQAEPYKVNGCGFALPIDQRVPRARSNRDPGPASQCGEKEPLTFPGVGGASDGISPIPEGLPKLFGEEDNWSARGILLFRPPDLESEFVLKLQGSRLDQQPVVGQAIGTGGFPNSGPSGFGGIVNGQGSFATNYTEPDQRRAFLALCQLQQPGSFCLNPDAGATLARDLARNLDDRPFRLDVNREGRTRLETFGTALNATIPLPETGFSTFEFQSITGFDIYKRFQERDTDFTPETIFESRDDDEAKQIWQELALNGVLGFAPIEWDAGAYYFWEDLDADLLLLLPKSVFSQVDTNVGRKFEQKTNAFGAWMNGSWDFLEKYTLDAGVRYNWENKKFDFVRRQTVGIAFVEEDETWSEWTGHISLEHRFTEDISLTMKYSRGFKPGTFNAGVNAQAQTDPVEPESIDAFEAILATSFFERRFELRAEIFYYLYENYQIFLFRDQPSGPPALEVRNAAEAENFGMDLDVTLRPLQGFIDERFEKLKVNFKIGWLESQFIEFTDTQLLEPFGLTLPVEIDFSSNRLPNSPRITVAGSVEWAFELGRLGEITPRYDFTFQDDTFFAANEGRGNTAFDGTNNLPKFGTGQRAFFLHNVRLTYRPPNSRVEVAGWVRNVLDQHYKTFAFDASAFSNLVINNVGPPRTFGADIKFTF